MFLFKSSHKEKELVESEESEDEEETYSENILDYANDRLLKKNPTQYHAIISSNSLELVKKWALNRKINDSYVNELKKVYIQDIIQHGYPRLLDPIHISTYIDSNGDNIYEIIDGQHRYKALYELHDDQTLNLDIFDVSIELHLVKSEEEKMELFDKINRRKQINREDLIDYKIPIFIDKLAEYWKENHTFEIYGSQRPRINKSVLESKMKTCMDKLDKYKIVDLMDIFFQINKDIGKLPRKHRCGKIGTASRKMHDRTDDIKFYLGMDNKLGWLDKIV